MTLTFSYAARSDVGLMRSTNQDSGYAGPHLLVLADGMGGPAGGDIASSIAIAHLAPLDGDSHAGDLLTLLRNAVAEAHSELRSRALADPELAGLGTTLIAALRSGKKLSMVHIGDSRAYLVREGQVSRLTTDHTYVQHLVELGQLAPEEAENHPHRSVILRVLGDHDFGVDLDESVRELRAGDRFLLCSDGVSSFVSADTITESLLEIRDPGECADHLVDLALRAGGPDNITAVIADVVELDTLADGAAPSTTPQVVGAAAAHWQQPTRGGSGAAAKAAALMKQATPAESDAATADGKGGAPAGDAPSRTKRRKRGAWITTAALVVALVAASWAGYRWTQTQHYVAASGQFVAIYQGIPQSLGPLELSTVVQTTDLRVDELPVFAQERLDRAITSENGTLLQAEEIVDGLRTQVPDPEPTPSPSPTASPTSTATPTPTATASATPPATPAATATP